MKVLLIILILTTCTNKNNENENSSILNNNKTQAILKTVYGNIKIKFFYNKAPTTINRVQKLINDGFYDGLTFHKVIPNFIIQTGDPTNSGSGGTGLKLDLELSKELKHGLGTIAMARGQTKDSADSQFYISLKELPELDNKYTIFAQVIDGLELLKKIQKGDKILTFSLVKK